MRYYRWFKSNFRKFLTKDYINNQKLKLMGNNISCIEGLGKVSETFLEKIFF